MEERSKPIGREGIPGSTAGKQCRKLRDVKAYLDALLSQNRYIAQSEYRSRLEKEAETIAYFDVLESSQMLEPFCQKSGVPYAGTKAAYLACKHLEKMVDAHNEAYLCRAMTAEKDYLDHIIEGIDPKIRLDEDQRRVVLTDEDHCLVIAGAGAGKTTTVAAKVKYLVEKREVDPSQILVVSFTNKAVQELRDRLNGDLAIPCVVSTFHAAGNAILREESGEALSVVDPSRLYFILQDYFKGSVLKNEALVNNMIDFFATYFNDPSPIEGKNFEEFYHEIVNADFTTMRSELQEDYQRDVIGKRKKRGVTIRSEVVRSQEEVAIANFLYLNQIDYEYEPIYRYNIPGSKKPYTPDFLLRQGDREAYLEHFGISEDGKSTRFSDDELAFYKKGIRTKIALHREHGTTLLYTYSRYLDGRDFLDHLREQLEKNGFRLQPRSNQEVMEMLVSTEENRYIKGLLNLLCRFIENFKTNGYAVGDFDRMRNTSNNVRTKLFLDICQECYLEYERVLKKSKAIDFQDMINESARLLREAGETGKRLDWKYVIVDEYQDISRQRFDLVTAISGVSDAKIVAVGDDWQSIYAFSGSDITLFTQFKEKMGYAKLLKIVNTYRNAQEVIDIAGGFIQKNRTQIPKQLKSPKTISKPVIIYTYDASRKDRKADNNKSGANYNLAKAVEVALEQIMEFNEAEGKPKDSSILLLGRYGFDGDRLEKTGLFEYRKKEDRLRSVKYPKLNITFMTAHASKGLGYDNVIVINGQSGTYGFPCKRQDDPILGLVIKSDPSIAYAEERRLFYVAMTRTKNRVYFIAPKVGPSEFLVEIERDYKNVNLWGEWDGAPVPDQTTGKFCPICGYPLQLRYKQAYGLRLYICTNEPEMCDFMTNDPEGGKLSILKCECRDGYLIVRRGNRDGYFLGCTNYKEDGTGCNNRISQSRYYDMFGLDPDPVSPKEFQTVAAAAPEATARTVPAQPTAGRPRGQTEHVGIKRADIEAVMYGAFDLNDVVHTVLQCLSHLSEKNYYGVGTLTDVLRGASSKRIIAAELDWQPEYAMLKGLSREDVTAIIEWLIENRFILRTNHPRYPVLHPTYEGMHYGEFLTADRLQRLLEELPHRPT